MGMPVDACIEASKIIAVCETASAAVVHEDRFECEEPGLPRDRQRVRFVNLGILAFEGGTMRDIDQGHRRRKAPPFGARSRGVVGGEGGVPARRAGRGARFLIRNQLHR